MCGRFNLKPLFLGKFRPERDDQWAANKFCLEAQAAHLFLKAQMGGPIALNCMI